MAATESAPAGAGSALSLGKNCPRCDSPSPERHPAVQHEGEVEICTDPFHLTPTNMNRPQIIAAVCAKIAEQEGRDAS
jgi:hypothetical protein